MHVDRPIDDARIVAAVDRVDQVITAEDAPRATHETKEQPELEWRKFQRRSVEAGLHRIRVDLEAIGEEDRLIIPGVQSATPEERPDARHELPRRERLDDVIVGANVESHDLIGVARPRGEHQDWYVASGADPMRDLEAIETGKHDVEDHEIGSCTQGSCDGNLTVRRLERAMAVALNVEPQKFADLRVVVDEEDCGHRTRVYDRGVTHA